MSKDIWNDDNLTSYKPKMSIMSGSRWTRLRHWLIKRLAGNTTVMINFTVTGKITFLHAERIIHGIEVEAPFEIGPRAAASRGEITIRKRDGAR